MAASRRWRRRAMRRAARTWRSAGGGGAPRSTCGRGSSTSCRSTWRRCCSAPAPGCSRTSLARSRRLSSSSPRRASRTFATAGDEFRRDHGSHVVSPPTQEAVVSTTATRISKLGTVVIPVSDQDKMIDFYVETLGFEKRTDLPFGDGYRWVEVAPAGAATTIALAPPPEGVPTGNSQTGIGLNTSDIDAVHADLKAAGADVDAEVARQGDPVPPLFWFRDPEGNTLMVVEMPES